MKRDVFERSVNRYLEMVEKMQKSAGDGGSAEYIIVKSPDPMEIVVCSVEKEKHWQEAMKNQVEKLGICERVGSNSVSPKHKRAEIEAAPCVRKR